MIPPEFPTWLQAGILAAVVTWWPAYLLGRWLKRATGTCEIEGCGEEPKPIWNHGRLRLLCAEHTIEAVAEEIAEQLENDQWGVFECPDCGAPCHESWEECGSCDRSLPPEGPS